MGGSYFYMLPSGLFDLEITDGARLTYGVILSLSNRYGYCFATNSVLADLRHISESSLKRHIKELIDKKAITAEYNARNDRRIFPSVFPQNPLKRKNTRSMGHIDPELDKALDDIYKKIKVYR